LTPETKRLWGTRVASLVVLGALGAAAAFVTPHLDVTTDLAKTRPSS
jgi:hypothetical protein